MKPLTSSLFALLVFVFPVYSAPIVLDFSRSHTVDDLKKSGLRLSPIFGGIYGQSYSFTNQIVEIRLPLGRCFRQEALLGTIDTDDVHVSTLRFYGGVMPHEEAFKVALAFREAFGLPLKPLQEWSEQNKNAGRNGKGVSSSTSFTHYPICSLSIDNSINPLYPWVLSLQLDWGFKEQRGWNEKRAEREILPPEPHSAVISIDPPSGVKYNPTDAYAEILRESDRMLAAQTNRAVALSSPASAGKSSIQPSIAPSSQRKWIFYGTGVLALLLAILGAARRRRGGRTER